MLSAYNNNHNNYYILSCNNNKNRQNSMNMTYSNRLQLPFDFNPAQTVYKEVKSDNVITSGENITTSIVKNNVFFRNLSYSFKQLMGDRLIDFNSSSATLIKQQDGFMMNVRSVNYHLDNQGKSSHIKGDKTVTLNKLLFLDEETNIINSKNIITDITKHPYCGVEDVRLFPFNNDTYFIGSSFNPKTNKIGIVSDILNVGGHKFEQRYITPSFKTTNKWEKNWVFFANSSGELNVIYKWYPLYICKIDYGTNKLELIKQNDTVPVLFTKFRGSTCGIEYENKIWFITHFVETTTKSTRNMCGKNRYLHCFVVFDKDMNLLGYSAPFNFENYLVEYCIGMTVNKSKFVITYSTLDSTTKMAMFTSEYVNSLIIHS